MNAQIQEPVEAPEATAEVDPEQSEWDFSEGDEIVSRRYALRRLGGGFRYEAYLAWDELLRTVVVVKVLRPGLVESERAVRGLAGEAALLERINHPVIVRAFDAVLEGPRPHLVLEHLEGPRLSTLIRKYGPLPVEQLVPLAVELSAAIHYLGEIGIVHLDVKPSNTIMGAPPRLIDLSVALTSEECATLTNHVGTDGYMAPEQCDPEALGPVAAPADVWGLGATLYRAATGEKPFPDGDPDAGGPARWPQLEVRPEPLDGRLAPAIAEPIMACFAFGPADRPTAAEVASQLEQVLGALPKPRLSRLKPRIRT